LPITRRVRLQLAQLLACEPSHPDQAARRAGRVGRIQLAPDASISSVRADPVVCRSVIT